MIQKTSKRHEILRKCTLTELRLRKTGDICSLAHTSRLLNSKLNCWQKTHPLSGIKTSSLGKRHQKNLEKRTLNGIYIHFILINRASTGFYHVGQVESRISDYLFFLGRGGASACLFNITTDVSIIVGFIIYHNQLQ